MPIKNKRLFLKLLILRRIQDKRRHRRSLYVRNIFEARGVRGELQLVKELQEDYYYHFRYFRMDKRCFEELLDLSKKDLFSRKNHRRPITPLEKLAVTLRYLATGNSQVCLGLSFQISPQAVSVILRQTMTVLCKTLEGKYLPPPTVDTWKTSEEGFRNRWNFPNAVAAIDGKLCRIKAPRFGGSNYFNYKHYHSVVLLALVDPSYRFIAVDIESCGSQSDGGVFSRSALGRKILDGSIGLPSPKPVGNNILPHVILGDAAYSLQTNMMKPFPGKFLPISQRIFNYRMSRGRMVVENAFGILAARWRIFQTAITGDMDLINLIIRTTVILHNFLMSKNDLNTLTMDTENGDNPGSWRSTIEGDTGLTGLTNQGSNNYSGDAKDVRQKFCDYFNGEGAVPWQDNMI